LMLAEEALLLTQPVVASLTLCSRASKRHYIPGVLSSAC
jgi:hypothetical protein